MSDLPPWPSRIVDVHRAVPPSLRLVEVLVYARMWDGRCSLCLHPDYVQLVELSYRKSNGDRVVRWMSRNCCRICIRILEERAEGKITYCPF